MATVAGMRIIGRQKGAAILRLLVHHLYLYQPPPFYSPVQSSPQAAAVPPQPAPPIVQPVPPAAAVDAPPHPVPGAALPPLSNGPTFIAAPVPPPPRPIALPPPLKRVLDIILLVSLFTAGFALLACLVLAVVSVPVTLPELLAPHPEDPELSFAFFLITPVPLVFAVVAPPSPGLGAWYLLLVVSVIASPLLLLRKEGGALLDELAPRLRSLRAPDWHTPRAVLQVGLLFLAVFAFDQLYFILITPFLEAAPAAPSFGALWTQFYLLINASVYEELVGRVLLIGLPMLAFRWFQAASAGRPLAPSPLRYIYGGGFPLTRLPALLLLGSSVFFGLAHLFGGWDWVKVAPTFVAGLAFGYLYLKHGLPAAILLHFLFDYIGLLPEVYGGASDYVMLALVILWALAGIYPLYQFTRGFALHLRALFTQKYYQQ